MMPTNTIFIRSSQGGAVSALVEFRKRNTDLSEITPTDINGEVCIPNLEGLSPDICIVQPSDRHWQTFSDNFMERREVVCDFIGDNTNLHWWKNIVGVEKKANKYRDVKIGVVDVGFVPRYDNLGTKVKNLPRGRGHEGNFHGFNVVKVINDVTDYIFSDSIILMNAVNEDGLYLDSDAVCESISALVDDYEIDIINLSNGFYSNGSDAHLRALERISEEIRYAQENGAVVVAAGGSRSQCGLAYPARLTNVMGIGSLGRFDLAPENSLCYMFQRQAADTLSCVGSTSRGVPVFADMKGSYGEGLDFVAPGISVFLRYKTGVMVEQFGSSFSAPIVSSLIALEMNREGSPVVKRSPERQGQVKEFLTNIREDLGITIDRQGLGMPVWR